MHIWKEWPQFFRGFRGIRYEYSPIDRYSWRYDLECPDSFMESEIGATRESSDAVTYLRVPKEKAESQHRYCR